MSLIRFPLTSRKTPAVPKDTAWQDYTGDVNSPMVGIMVPQGVYIIDVDLYKGVTTSDIDELLGCELDWENAELQKTLNGGQHYAFACSDELRQGSNIFGLDGFDTRAAGKGYIATGEGYEDLTLFGLEDTLSDVDELPELPKAAIDKLLDNKQELILADEDDDLSLLDVVNSQPIGLTEQEIKEYLALLPNSAAENQDDWYMVGMGVWHETQGSDEGWRLFDDFSRRSPANYDETKNRRRWDSFSNKSGTNPITFGSVIKLAGGARAEADVVVKLASIGIEEAETVDHIHDYMVNIANSKIDNMTLDTLLKKIQKKHKEITGDNPSLPSIKKELKSLKEDKRSGDYIDDYVFATRDGEYIDRHSKSTMGPRSFDVKHSRDTPTDQEGAEQSATNYVNNKIEIVESMMYVPMALEHGDVFDHAGLTYLNSYIPNNLPRVKAGTTDIVERLKGHIAHLLVDKKEQDLVINYIAHNVQYPGKKIPWCPVLQGVEGDGKSLLAEMTQIVLGYNNVRMMNASTLEAPFTGWAVGQCMTFIEELKIDNVRKYEVLNNLKPYITNPMIETTAKGKDPISALNTTNYFALTNFQDAIPINENDRRYAVFFSQWQNREKLQAFMNENPDYYSSLYTDMRASGGELLDWLLTHKIPDSFKALNRAPDTAAKQRMVEITKSPGRIAVEDALSEFADQVISEDELNITMLQNLVRNTQQFDMNNTTYEEFPMTRALKNVLLDMGWQPNGRKRAGDGSNNKHSFYIKG